VKASIVMVHGFGTSKHETAGYFDDLSSALVNDHYRVIRFDFSGYGNSEGRQEDTCYQKHVKDLKMVTNYVNNNYSEPIYIFAQSMGCFITALADLEGIAKTIMTGIPNADTQIIIDRLVERFGSRPGAKLNMEGISQFPRSTGKVQKIGSGFWEDIKSLKPLELIGNYAKNTKLLIVHWNQDEILGFQHLKEYDTLPGVSALWLDGDHSVKKESDRQKFIKIMLNFFNK